MLIKDQFGNACSDCESQDVRVAFQGPGNVKADVLALKDPTYKRLNFCGMILGSSWNDGACGVPGCRH